MNDAKNLDPGTPRRPLTHYDVEYVKALKTLLTSINNPPSSSSASSRTSLVFSRRPLTTERDVFSQDPRKICDTKESFNFRPDFRRNKTSPPAKYAQGSQNNDRLQRKQFSLDIQGLRNSNDALNRQLIPRYTEPAGRQLQPKEISPSLPDLSSLEGTSKHSACGTAGTKVGKVGPERNMPDPMRRKAQLPQSLQSSNALRRYSTSSDLLTESRGGITTEKSAGEANVPMAGVSRQSAKSYEESSVIQTTLFIRIHAVIHDIAILGRLLTSRLSAAGVVELSPTETSIKRNNSYTFCFLTCSSKSQARKLQDLLMQNRRKLPPPLIDCSFTEFNLEEEAAASERLGSQKKPSVDKERLQKQTSSEFSSLSESTLQKHIQKMDQVQNQLDTARQQAQNRRSDREVHAQIAALENKLDELQKQKAEFKKALERLGKKMVGIFAQDDFEKDVKAFRKQLGVECGRLEKALPMYARRQDIVELVHQNPVSILLAETGSGKSTQVVQYLLEEGLADNGTIVCTQPRKVAAITLATHVANELASSVGDTVGYKVGSKFKKSFSTKIVYMTDHALLNECLTDPDLKAYTCVVVDEAHERSLFTDLLLTMIKRCLARRQDLRVIITSATIDPQLFVRFFSFSCPVMKVSGRAFPVDVIWQDSASEENEFEKYVEAAVDKAVEIHLKESPGDVLVFLTSAGEIQKCCDMFQNRLRDRQDYKCFPLHGQLQADEQQKVFQPLEKNVRKIVFATNCAETSITIDGIKYVVDTGVAKEMRYDAKKNINSLAVTAISQSSAEQRKGRAGRTAPGKCYRLYSRSSYGAMDTISLPEILKTHLGHALLKLAELGITPDMYDFVQSPSPDSIEAALRTLHQLGALHNDVITDTGRWIARMPFDPKLGLMTLLGHQSGLLYDVIVLASIANAGSGLFYRGTSDISMKKLDKVKIKFSQEGGDILTSLEVYKAWKPVDQRQRHKWCMDNSVNAKAMNGVEDSIREVIQLLQREAKLEVAQQFSDAPDTPDKLRKIIFRCSAPNLCHYLGLEKAGYFAACAQRQVHFHPSSSMSSLGSYPEWVVYDQLLQTSRDFITGITPVDNAWLREISKDQYGFDIEQVRQKKLIEVFTQPAGSHAFFSLVGPRYSKLRQYEELFPQNSSDVVVIEASRETGELRVFSTATVGSLQKLTQNLSELAKKSEVEVQQEVRELTVGSENSGLRVVLGKGGELSDILMPHETRKVFVTAPSDDATEEVVREKFEVFGNICYIHQFPSGRNWGFVVFSTSAQAKEAESLTRDDDSNVGELERRRPVKQQAEFKARLFWCRRPCNGTGFVEVSPAYMSRCMQLGHFYVGNSLVRIAVNRKRPDESLYLRGLPAEVTEDLIKRSLLHELDCKENSEGVIDKLTVVRQKIGKTSKKDIDKLQEELKEQIQAKLENSAVNISVWAPRGEETARFSAEARFSDPIEGFAACRSLRGKLYQNNALVEIEPVISAALLVPGRVYEVCKAELEKLIEEKLERMMVELTVEEKIKNKGVCLISLKAKDPENIVQARTFVSNVVNGDVLDCNAAPALRHLMSSAGRKMLAEAERKTSSYISVDNRKWTISIHGSSKACTQVRVKINSYLEEVLSGTSEELPVRGGGKPPGLLKALMGKYDEDLDNLRTECGLHAVAVDFRRQVVKLTGPSTSLAKAKKLVDEVSEALRAAYQLSNPEDEDAIDCAACFCPIDKDDLYRLEACAHPYCKGCVKHQVSCAVKDHSLPVLCCREGCGRPLSWRDFNALSRLGHLKLSDLATSALASYVLTNREKACFCTTPDCPMVYRVTSEECAEVFQCPECNVRICTACQAQAHDGLTCAMLRSSKTESSGVDAWIGTDRKNRRACPECRVPIEKIGGCNKMICGACNAIFCWLCDKVYSTSDQCYKHLTAVHGGVFDVNDLLRQ